MKTSKGQYEYKTFGIFFTGQVISNYLNKTEGGLIECSTYRLLEIISDESSPCDKYVDIY